MRTRSIQPGDLILVNKRGRVFHATVRGVAAGGGFEVAPIERGITWRHVKPSEINEHWARTGVRREGRPPTGQLGLRGARRLERYAPTAWALSTRSAWR